MATFGQPIDAVLVKTNWIWNTNCAFNRIFFADVVKNLTAPAILQVCLHPTGDEHHHGDHHPHHVAHLHVEASPGGWGPVRLPDQWSCLPTNMYNHLGSTLMWKLNQDFPVKLSEHWRTARVRYLSKSSKQGL